MKKLIIPVILFLLLVLEGVAIELLPVSLFPIHYLIVPHWVFIFLVIVMLFYDTSETFFGIIYAVIFGLLIDIVYTDFLGIYMLVYPFSIYIDSLLKQVFQANFYITMLLYTLGIIIVELFILFIYNFIGLIDIINYYFLLDRFIRTILSNLLFIIFIYTFIGVIDIINQHFLLDRLLLTILENLIFLIFIYPLFTKRLYRWQMEQVGNF